MIETRKKLSRNALVEYQIESIKSLKLFFFGLILNQTRNEMLLVFFAGKKHF
jgi:hypothetical protein